MQNEDEYFAKRDRDVLSGFGTMELEYICKELKNSPEYENKGDNIRVLDVGCGSGMAMLRMTKEFMHLKNVSGIDLSPFAIEIAKQRGLDCKVDSAELLETIPPNSFDFIYCQHVLEHTDPTETIVACMKAAPRAIFLFPIGETFDTNEEEKEFKFENERQHTLFHNYVLTEQGLIDVLKSIPNIEYKITRNIIQYTSMGQDHYNFMLVVSRKQSKKKKGE